MVFRAQESETKRLTPTSPKFDCGITADSRTEWRLSHKMNINCTLFCCVKCCCDQVEDDHKKPFDKILDKKKRQCTDVLWLFVFGIFSIGLIYLAIYSVKNGNLARLYYPADSFGNLCGQPNPKLLVRYDQKVIGYFPNSGMALQLRPYIFPLNANRPDESLWICVDHCPASNFPEQTRLSSYLADRNGSLCDYNFDLFMYTKPNISNLEECPKAPVYASKLRLNRCVPNELAEIPSKSASAWVNYVVDHDFLRQLTYDFLEGLYIYSIVCIVTICISAMINYALIWGNHKFVYNIYIAALPFGIVCSIFLLCAFLYNLFASKYLESRKFNLEPIAERFINGFRVEYGTLLFFAILVAIFTIFAWALTWTIFKPRSNLVLELFVQARRPTKFLLWLLPEVFCNTLLSLCLFAIWLYVFANLLTICEPKLAYLITESGPSKPIFELELPRWTTFALLFHFAGFFWVKAFLSDVQKFIIAHAASSWYFGESEHRRCYAIYFRSVFFLIRYHLGSLAFGSFLLTALRIPSHIYLLLYYRFFNAEHPVVKCFCGRLESYFTRAEKMLCYIHSNAYAVVSTNGENFLRASRTAGNLWMDNSWYLLSTNTVASMLFTLLKFMFLLLVAFITGIYFRWNSSIEYWTVPTLFSAALAYFIMNQFLSLHKMIIDTMFLCYACEIDGLDSQRQDSPIMFHMKTDYGFYCYMRRRIEEERRMNNSVTPLQQRKLLHLTTIGQLSSRAENGNTSLNNHMPNSTPLISLSLFERHNALS